MSKVFISFIHEEEEVALALSQYLRDYKLETFLSADKRLIRSGDRWFQRITDELADAKILIALLSPISVARPWINFEAGWAWGKGIATIPVCFGGLDKGEMPRPYSDVQGLNLEKDTYTLVLDCHAHIGRSLCPPPKFADASLEKLISALQRRAQSHGGR